MTPEVFGLATVLVLIVIAAVLGAAWLRGRAGGISQRWGTAIFNSMSCHDATNIIDFSIGGGYSQDIPGTIQDRCKLFTDDTLPLPAAGPVAPWAFDAAAARYALDVLARQMLYTGNPGEQMAYPPRTTEGRIFEDAKHPGGCAVFRAGGQAWVSFRGTFNQAELREDFDVAQTTVTLAGGLTPVPGVPPPANGGCAGLCVHRGFLADYLVFQDRVAAWLAAQAGVSTLYITGHSLGAAVACLCAADLATRRPDLAVRLVTFGTPRAGNAAFAYRVAALAEHAMIVSNTEDVVANIPPASMPNGASTSRYSLILYAQVPRVHSFTLPGSSWLMCHIWSTYLAGVRALAAREKIPGGLFTAA